MWQDIQISMHLPDAKRKIVLFVKSEFDRFVFIFKNISTNQKQRYFAWQTSSKTDQLKRQDIDEATTTVYKIAS